MAVSSLAQLGPNKGLANQISMAYFQIVFNCKKYVYTVSRVINLSENHL